MTNEMIVKEIQQGQSVTENMQLLYESNIPLIKRLIRPYTAYECEEDLLQETYFGLWEAVQHYEESENVLFMTYAGYWIKRAVREYMIKCGSAIKYSHYMKNRIIRYKKTVQIITQELGAIPSDAEIADKMKLDISDVISIRMYAQEVSSLDSEINEDNEMTVGDTIPDDFNLENAMTDKLYNEYIKTELWKIIDEYMNETESRIIKEYYKYNMPASEIAEREDISKNQVHEIRKRALKHLNMGKLKIRLLEKFEVVDAGIYRNSMIKFNEHNYTSTVEYIAMQRAEIQAEYEKKVQECLQYTPRNERVFKVSKVV